MVLTRIIVGKLLDFFSVRMEFSMTITGYANSFLLFNLTVNGIIPRLTFTYLFIQLFVLDGDCHDLIMQG